MTSALERMSTRAQHHDHGSACADACLSRTRKTLVMLGTQLAPLVRKTSPFVAVPKAGMSGSIWVKPKLVAQIKYNEMTGSGVLRQPSYLGLRDDKQARDVRLEADTSATAILDALNCGS